MQSRVKNTQMDLEQMIAQVLEEPKKVAVKKRNKVVGYKYLLPI